MYVFRNPYFGMKVLENNGSGFLFIQEINVIDSPYNVALSDKG